MWLFVSGREMDPSERLRNLIVSSGRMGLFRLDYQIKGYQEYKRGEGVSLKHTPLHWKRVGLPGFGYPMCAESEEYRFWTCWLIGVERLMYSSISWMYWWVTEPKAFWRSMKVRAIRSEFRGALSKMDWTARMCSIQPLMPWRKPIWRDVSMMLLGAMYLSRRIAMILWNSLAKTEDKAIWQKFPGLWGSPDLLILAWHQELGGSWECSRIFEKRVPRKWCVEGSFLYHHHLGRNLRATSSEQFIKYTVHVNC